MKDFDKDRRQVLDRARQGGLSHIITIGIDLSSSRKAVELASQYDFIFATIGYHPHNADRINAPALKKMEKLAMEPSVVAWGEIGLDFFRNRAAHTKQMDSVKQQVRLASRFQLPVTVHDRDAHGPVLDILKARGKGRRMGVIHCFSGSYDLAMTFVDLGYYISIPGIVTYKNADLVRDVASRIPLETMLIETDAPFLTPVPFRGKRNEPLFVKYTAEEIARLRHMEFDDLARRTAENTMRLFNIPHDAETPSEKN
jgi:TatD DNase family protein